MALITCKYCGKKISDTVSTCIHCGKSVVEETTTVNEPEFVEEIQDDESTEKTNETDRKEFSSLSKKEQEDLVHEFWKKDKKAFKYKKKTYILKKIGEEFSIIYYIPIGLALLADKLLNFKPQNQKAYIALLLIPLGMLVIEIVKGIIYHLILKPIFNGKIKKMAYSKRFQIWADKETDIYYYPVFMDKKEEQMYEQLDINKIVL